MNYKEYSEEKNKIFRFQPMFWEDGIYVIINGVLTIERNYMNP